MPGFAAELKSNAPGAKVPSKIAYPILNQIKNCTDARNKGMRDLSPLSSSNIEVSTAGMLHILVHAKGSLGDDRLQTLVKLGAKIVAQTKMPEKMPKNIKVPVAGMAEVWAPFNAVQAIADLDWVAAITTADPGEVDSHPLNNINSEGVGQHNANLLLVQGFNGAGVNVGAISDGVTNLAASQAANELPAVTVLGVGVNDEGTAMLELIHDMAPGAALLFQGTGGSVATHVNAMNNLAANGANVIAEDIAYDTEPAFQQGLAAQTADGLAAGGVSIHSSAGNRGANHAARGNATGTGGGPDGNAGPFAGCARAPTNTVAIAPGGDTTFDVVLGNNGGSVTLQWSEPRAIFPTAGQGGFTDLDLYIMDQTGTQCLFESSGAQGNGAGDTLERVTFGAGLGGTAVKIVVNVFGAFGAAAVPVIDLRWRGTAAQTDVPTRAGSLNPDSNYIGLATSSAAVNTTTGLLEGFSSGGPVQLGLTTLWNGAGNPGLPGPGVAATAGPTWAAADGTSISGAGGFGAPAAGCPTNIQGNCRFFGTSAAAPHAAGCDALVRAAFNNPGANPLFINAQLASTATDMGAPGPDNNNGAGLLNCLAAAGAPTARCQDRTVPTDPGVCIAASVSIDNGSSDPEGQPLALSQNPAAPYNLGNTITTLTVTDQQGITDTCSATIAVQDLENPIITAPADVTAECASAGGTAVILGSPVVNDNCSISTVSNNAPALFPLGSTTVTWTAIDGSGNPGTDTQTVTIEDTIPPVLTVSVTPSTIWPPNHKMVTITADITATDGCDDNVEVRLVSIVSNEADNGQGDGNTTNDIQDAEYGTDDREFKLRAERSGKGSGRVYTITYEAEDNAGNTTTRQVIVTVPKSKK
jgi:hypothetical protein